MFSDLQQILRHDPLAATAEAPRPPMPVGQQERRQRRLYTRNGYNFAVRFPQIVEAVSKLKVRSCFIDGEAIVVDGHGLSAFDLLRSWRHDHAVVLCAFDLIEIDGKDLRSVPIEERNDVLYRERDGIVFNVHYDCDGATIFKHACALGCEGIVSKRLGSPYRSGRVEHWLKIKNPAAPAAKREGKRTGATSDGATGGDNLTAKGQ